MIKTRDKKEGNKFARKKKETNEQSIKIKKT